MSVSLPAYCRSEFQAGRFPVLKITESSNVFWLHDSKWEHLDCKCFKTREAAEKRFWVIAEQVFDKTVM